MLESKQNIVSYKNRDETVLALVQMDRNLFRELDKILRKKSWQQILREYLDLEKLACKGD